MFAEQIHSRSVLNNLSRKKEYFVIAFYIDVFPFRFCFDFIYDTS